MTVQEYQTAGTVTRPDPKLRDPDRIQTGIPGSRDPMDLDPVIRVADFAEWQLLLFDDLAVAEDNLARLAAELYRRLQDLRP